MAFNGGSGDVYVKLLSLFRPEHSVACVEF